MKLLLSTLLVLFTTAQAWAADPPQTATDPKAEAAMKAFMEAATPGETHKVLAELAGKWKYTSKWWQAPNTTPEESKGNATFKMIMGGRYLQTEVKGKAMGKPFEGMGLFGFDNIKGQYETLWLDNMGTGFVRGTGTYEASTKVLKDTGEYSCPISQNKTRAYRAEWKLIDKTHTVYEMWSTTPEGTEYKQMEMAYLRTK